MCAPTAEGLVVWRGGVDACGNRSLKHNGEATCCLPGVFQAVLQARRRIDPIRFETIKKEVPSPSGSS